jgi:hypothetical protein
VKRGCAILFVLAAVIVSIIGKCTGTGDDQPVTESTNKADVVTTPVRRAEEGTPFDVASDPRASYRLLKWSPLKNGNIEAVTLREGPSGISYARREIDCDDQTFRYLGEGDTRQDAMRDSPNIGEMSALVSGSISAVTVDVVCAEARR